MNNALLGLLQLCDPALPIGNYAHSAGLETYVQEGIVKDLTSSSCFVSQMLQFSLQYNDAAFASLSYDAAQAEDLATILKLDRLCSASKLPTEMRQASNKLGRRLLKIFEPLCSNKLSLEYATAVMKKEAFGHYSIAFGLYASALQVQKEAALTGFYYNALAGLITNCVKLVPLSQQDGQELLFSFTPLLTELVKDTMVPEPDLLGLSCVGFDIRSMQHEQLYSRLYMS